MEIQPAEVNGTKPKSLRTGREMPHKQQKSRARDFPYSALNSFLWVFSATILRPLTSARNYATIADRKNKFGGVISEYIFRNNRARKRIRTPIFHRGSYAHRLAQRRGFEPPDESPPSHDFQSCSLNHSDISASDMCYFTTNARKKQLLFVAFFIFFARRANIFQRPVIVCFPNSFRSL